MKAYEVSDGFDDIFVETMEDAELVSNEWKRRANVINQAVRITIESVEIIDIPSNERAYMEQLRTAEEGKLNK